MLQRMTKTKSSGCSFGSEDPSVVKHINLPIMKQLRICHGRAFIPLTALSLEAHRQESLQLEVATFATTSAPWDATKHLCTLATLAECAEEDAEGSLDKVS